VPYRVDIAGGGADAFDRLVELGALDAELLPDGGLAAIMPDAIAPEQVARALEGAPVATSRAVGRDDDSVWVLSRRPLRVGRQAITLLDAPAFGTGLHPTTALCIEALEDLVPAVTPHAVLDVGTGSGVLAITALRLGVSRACGIDLDEEALRVAAENARRNGVADRLALTKGGPETIAGTWPLVVANVLAAPLVEMAPALVRRVGHAGHLVLSGIASSLAPEVEAAYRHVGMRHVRTATRGGWAAFVMRTSW
jgi:ribosomal protein L11 methyltransferase